MYCLAIVADYNELAIDRIVTTPNTMLYTANNSTSCAMHYHVDLLYYPAANNNS